MDKLTKDLHHGIAVGDSVRDKRNGRGGIVIHSSSQQLAGDVLLTIEDEAGTWNAYVRQVTQEGR